jgi:alpha/beta superfamily hydrolase
MRIPVDIYSDGLRLWGEVYRPDQSSPPALVICHGIPGAPPIPEDKGYPELAERFCREGFLTLLFNFRGAGESQGNFDILAWTRDLASTIDYLHTLDDLDVSRLSVMGFSGGAAVAIYVAARDPRITSLVAAASPAEFSIIGGSQGAPALLEHSRRVGIIRDPGFPPSVEEWVKGFEMVSPRRWIRQVSLRPLLILHGSDDELVPISQAWDLYEHAEEPKAIRVVEGAGHRLRLEEKAMSAALDWLQRTNGL